MRRLPYDPERDFTPVAALARGGNVIVVHLSVKANTLAELMVYARANPGRVRYCSAGIGSASSCSMCLTRVAVRASPTCCRGRSRCVSAARPPVRRMCGPAYYGRSASPALRAARTPLMPEEPTMPEAGFADFVYGPLFGLLLPAAAPAAVVARLRREPASLLREPAYKRRLVEIGAEETDSRTGEAFGRWMRNEA